MKTQTFVLFLLSSFLFSSCIITNTAGFHSGYKRLKDEQKSQIVFVDTNTAKPLPATDSRVQAITARHLDKLLAVHDTTVVYLWKPHCTSPSCLPLSSVYDYCQAHNYKLYIIMEYFTDLETSMSQFSDRYQVFGINYKYYKSDYCPAYTKRFIKQLVKGEKMPKSENYFRYFFFKGNHFIGSKEMLK